MEDLFRITKPSARMASLPYGDNQDYLDEEMQWLNGCIALQLAMNSIEDENDKARVYQRYARVLEDWRQHIRSRSKISMDQGVYLALPYLVDTFMLSELEMQAIMVCLAMELDRKYEAAYEVLQEDNGLRLPTPEFIARLISRSEEQWREVIELFQPNRALPRFFLRKDLKPVRQQGSYIGKPVQLDARMVIFLSGNPFLADSMIDFCHLYLGGEELPPLMGNEAVQTRLRNWMKKRFEQNLSEPVSLIVSLYGKPGIGKRLHLIHLANHIGEYLMFADCEKLVRKGRDLSEWLTELFREAAIHRAMLVLLHFREALEEANMLHRLPDLLDEIAALNYVVFLLSEKPCLPFDENRRIMLEIELPDLTDRERLETCRKAAEAYAVDPAVDWESLSTRFPFTPGQIVKAIHMAEELARWDDPEADNPVIHWHHLINACYKQLNHKLEQKAKRLKPKHSFDDLILPEPQKQKLIHACNHIRYKHTVYEKWGFNRKLSYGTGISMLFSGPPGTGKTMAAEIMAKELDMEIYKVDTAQIISKYVGETEKNLQEIFKEAESSYAILFFDEADAIFGKRSEVKDAHDKYANTEVAFLLQKMEEYRGISILATNFLQNIDEAFLRRFNYIIRFPFPDEAERERLWRHIFPEETPLQELDYAFLAQKLRLSGGQIKNVAITAAFLAGGAGESVGMKHILKAYQYELDKYNRPVDRKELGDYAALLDEG